MVSPHGILRMAVSTLWVNSFRSALTLIGMVFGTAAVIATMSSNEGAQKYIGKQLDSLGSNVITVNTDSKTLTQRDADTLKLFVPEIDIVALEHTVGPVSLTEKRRTVNATSVAVNPSYFPANRVTMERGREFAEIEALNADPVVVLGSEIAKSLFADAPPISKYVNMSINSVNVYVKVIGVARQKGGAAGSVLDASVFMSPQFAAKLTSPLPNPRLLATVVNEDRSAVAKARVSVILGAKFGNEMRVADSREAIERTQKIWANQNFVGLCLAAVSLLTGGVGIMNIMLLSIHQRRREIGLRKAVGAQDSEVAIQFLLEAVLICVAGGMLGVATGWAFGQQVAAMLGDWEAITSPQSVVVAIAFAAMTGVVFGLFPAVRASRIDPYDALRSS